MNRRRIADTEPTAPTQNYPTATDVPYAVLSRSAYVQYEKGNTQDTQKLLDDYNIGYTVVEDLTTPEYVTAINPDNQKIIVAFRGTDSTLLNISDDIADIEIGLGLAETSIPSFIPSRFSTGEYAYKQAKDRFPNYELTLTGHSLGGTTARYVGDKFQERAVVFNAGATPLEPIIDTIFRVKPSSAKFYFTDTLDLISNTSRLTENDTNIVTTKPEYKKYFTGSHKIENYLPEIPPKLNPINPKGDALTYLHREPLNTTIIKNRIDYASPVFDTIFNEAVINTIQESAPLIKNYTHSAIALRISDEIQKKQKAIKIQFTSTSPFQQSICETQPEKCYKGGNRSALGK